MTRRPKVLNISTTSSQIVRDSPSKKLDINRNSICYEKKEMALPKNLFMVVGKVPEGILKEWNLVVTGFLGRG